MREYLRELLVCPDCHGELAWTVGSAEGDRLLEGLAECTSCSAAYPVRNGIGVFLTPDLPRNDLWERSDNRLLEYLNANPEIERALVQSPLESLTPVDRYYRGAFLKRTGRDREASEAFESARKDLYTPERNRCLGEQLDHVIGMLKDRDGPVVDIASGMGSLARRIARETGVLLAVTDFSPMVLREDRRWFMDNGCYHNVSLLSFDARRTPFRDGSVETMTTCLGLANVEDPQGLLIELRRVVSGSLLDITHFYPEDDERNGQVLREHGMDKLLIRDSAMREFEISGWSVSVLSECPALDIPAEPGKVIRGARVDALPAFETTLQWCVLEAKPATS